MGFLVTENVSKTDKLVQKLNGAQFEGHILHLAYTRRKNGPPESSSPLVDLKTSPPSHSSPKVKKDQPQTSIDDVIKKDVSPSLPGEPPYCTRIYLQIRTVQRKSQTVLF